jgi:hypothetical protein
VTQRTLLSADGMPGRSGFDDGPALALGRLNATVAELNATIAALTPLIKGIHRMLLAEQRARKKR